MKISSLFLCIGLAAGRSLASDPDAPAPVSAGEPREFTVPLERQQAIGVTYAVAETRCLRRRILAAGTVAPMPARNWDYVARVDGYIHDLQVFAPGDRVAKGQRLMDLYSPDLVATESEYLDAGRMRDRGLRDHDPAAVENAGRLLESSLARLRQWNIAAEQLAAIERSGHPLEYLSLTSPVAGVVEDIGAQQGRRVSAGDRLVEIADLSSVWIWAEFYENELPLLKPGQSVTVTSSALPGLSASGRLSAIDPFLDPIKRTARVRIELANPTLKFVPGAYVDVALEIDEGDGLTIPESAVLQTGEHAIVFVDKGEGRLEPRFVTLAGEFAGAFHVTGGLKAGDRVVNSANFLIDAEAKVQGALKEL